MCEITYKYCFKFEGVIKFSEHSQLYILQTNMEGSEDTEIRGMDEERLYEIDFIFLEGRYNFVNGMVFSGKGNIMKKVRRG